jgi:uncharacterized integral membrane protein
VIDEPGEATGAPRPAPRPASRISSRTAVALAATLLLVVLVVIFIGQNGDEVKVNFLWLHGHMALGLALLIAAVVGGILALLLNTIRRVRKARKRS